MFGLKKGFGSVMDFVRDERLKWTDMKPRAKAFEDPRMCFLDTAAASVSCIGFYFERGFPYFCPYVRVPVFPNPTLLTVWT